MMRRPVSQIDPRFKASHTTYAGGELETFTAAPLNLPPCVGLYDTTLRRVTYPHLVERTTPGPPVRLYTPRGTP